MANAKNAVCGVYTNRQCLERAADTLVRSGFQSSDLSVLLADNSGRRASTGYATKGPEGAAMGAGSGAVVGGTLGLLAGIGALAIPGMGPFIAAGPIMATLAGVGIGGAMGGVAGALVGMGIPEYDARRYEGRLQRGGILLSLQCSTPTEMTRAKEVMERTGAQDISSSGKT